MINKKDLSDDTIIKFSLNIGIQGEQTDENELAGLVPEWQTMTEAAIKKALDKKYREWKKGYIDGSWQVVESFDD